MRPVPPYEMVSDIQCPLLGVYAEDDNLPSPENVAMFDTALTEAGKFHQFNTYPGTKHAFLNHTGASYNATQATAAWAEVDSWFEKHLR
jgi:carboxymethylenebutenolidase